MVYTDLHITGDPYSFQLTGGAQTPGDVYVLSITLSHGQSLHECRYSLQQWTHSETGGLPNSIFAQPSLVKYESFDGRKIPAFYYKPKKGKFMLW